MLRPVTTTVLDRRLEAALAFESPYVTTQLLKSRVAPTPAIADLLFTEIKRYLVLCEAAPETSYGMFSALVDEAWHIFVLHTREYADFGQRYFGRYLHHVPTDTGAATPRDTPSFADFQRCYEEFYSEPLPSVWFDGRNVSLSSRVVNDQASTMGVLIDDDGVYLTDVAGNVLLTVNDLAYPALLFVSRTHDFYIRELGDDLTAEEKVGLVAMLADLGIVRLAP
jgi:hypothetical protein